MHPNLRCTVNRHHMLLDYDMKKDGYHSKKAGELIFSIRALMSISFVPCKKDEREQERAEERRRRGSRGYKEREDGRRNTWCDLCLVGDERERGRGRFV